MTEKRLLGYTGNVRSTMIVYVEAFDYVIFIIKMSSLALGEADMGRLP